MAQEIFNYTGSVQTWQVPNGVCRVTITAVGAKGGNFSNQAVGGLGASIQGSFEVTPGEILSILVGGAGEDVGEDPDSDEGGGGGGGSFVWRGNGFPISELLVAAGGGGGAGSVDAQDENGIDAVTTENGTDGGGATGGTGGIGGDQNMSGGGGGNSNRGGGGGGGFDGSGIGGGGGGGGEIGGGGGGGAGGIGGNGTVGNGGIGGIGDNNGQAGTGINAGAGGAGSNAGPGGGGGGGGSGTSSGGDGGNGGGGGGGGGAAGGAGGFGGGGGGGRGLGGGGGGFGGGGGGGDVGIDPIAGGGGGSYNAGTSQNNQAGVSTPDGNGYVEIITFPNSCPPQPQPQPQPQQQPTECIRTQKVLDWTVVTSEDIVSVSIPDSLQSASLLPNSLQQSSLPDEYRSDLHSIDCEVRIQKEEINCRVLGIQDVETTDLLVQVLVVYTIPLEIICLHHPRHCFSHTATLHDRIIICLKDSSTTENISCRVFDVTAEPIGGVVNGEMDIQVCVHTEVEVKVEANLCLIAKPCQPRSPVNAPDRTCDMTDFEER